MSPPAGANHGRAGALSSLTGEDLGGKTLPPGVYCFDSTGGGKGNGNGDGDYGNGRDEGHDGDGNRWN